MLKKNAIPEEQSAPTQTDAQYSVLTLDRAS